MFYAQGYAISEKTDQCVLVRPVFELSNGLVTGIAVLVAITLLVIVSVMLVVFKYRKSVLIRAASREFCFAMLSFDSLIALGAVFYVIRFVCFALLCSAANT
jgi:hypothetical protein